MHSVSSHFFIFILYLCVLCFYVSVSLLRRQLRSEHKSIHYRYQNQLTWWTGGFWGPVFPVGYSASSSFLVNESIAVVSEHKHSPHTMLYNFNLNSWKWFNGFKGSLRLEIWILYCCVWRNTVTPGNNPPTVNCCLTTGSVYLIEVKPGALTSGHSLLKGCNSHRLVKHWITAIMYEM